MKVNNYHLFACAYYDVLVVAFIVVKNKRSQAMVYVTDCCIGMGG